MSYREEEFWTYRMEKFRKYSSTLIWIGALFNIFLLIPDYRLAESFEIIAILRLLFSLSLILSLQVIRRLDSYLWYSRWIFTLECLGILEFLIVFTLYATPNLLIQSLGLITTQAIIFLVPNKWKHRLIAGLGGAVGFFVVTIFFVPAVNVNDLAAAITYVSLLTFIFAVAARNSERYQVSEYISKKQLEDMGSSDHLTAIANRSKLYMEAEKWIRASQKDMLPLALIFFDVDNMKYINDTYGHEMGDYVLKRIASEVKLHIREGDVFARWGGDEFVILLPNTTRAVAEMRVEVLQERIKALEYHEGERIACSFGTAILEPESDLDTLISSADSDMYKQKSNRSARGRLVRHETL